MDKTRILGIGVSQRENAASDMQHLLSKYGCSIKTRIGLHEVNDGYCSTQGVIILELAGNVSEQERLETDLRKVEGLNIQKMEFNVR